MITAFSLLLVAQGQIGKPNLNQIPKVDTKNIKLFPYSFKEPQDGYLSSFKWDGDIPVNGTVGDAKKYEKVTKGVLSAMKSNGVPGGAVVLIANDQIVYSRGFGMSNLTARTEFLPTTASRCGSISKTATSLAALRLVEQGKLSLDDTLVTLFQLNNPGGGKSSILDGWEKVRVRDLMDQSSGIPGNAVYLTSHKMASDLKKDMRLNKADLLGYVLTKVKLDQPRKKWAYTNLNFELLSLIIEHKTGKPFNAALQDLVVKPLGIPTNQMFLSPTRAAGPDKDDLRFPEARCYQKSTQMLESIYEKDKKVPEAYGGLDGEILSGAGHIAFSAEAIAKIVMTLRTRPTTFLKQSLWDEVINKPAYVSSLTPNFNDNYYYSKGTWVTHTPGTNQYWFQHGAMLMHAAGNYFQYNNYEVVVLANSNSASGKLHDQVLSDAVKPNLPTL